METLGTVEAQLLGNSRFRRAAASLEEALGALDLRVTRQAEYGWQLVDRRLHIPLHQAPSILFVGRVLRALISTPEVLMGDLHKAGNQLSGVNVPLSLTLTNNRRKVGHLLVTCKVGDLPPPLQNLLVRHLVPE